MWALTSKDRLESTTVDRVEAAYKAMLSNSHIGFKNLDQFSKLKSKVEACRSSEQHIAIFGIGGSSMGTMAVAQALFSDIWREKFTVFDNVDAIAFEKKVKSIKDPKNTKWVVISKSGKTIETLSCYDFAVQFFEKNHNLDIRKNTVVITEEKENPLYTFAQKNQLKTLPVPQDVGGRFSVFTPVGLYPLACAEVPLSEIEKGLKAALDNKSRVIELSALLFESLQRQEFSFYNFYYTDRLVHWGEWLQQLWSESLSKANGPILNTMVPCRGAAYQHSVLQQVAEGKEKKLVCFVRTGDAESSSMTLSKTYTQNHLMEGKSLGDLLAAEAQATERALNEKGISTLQLFTKALDTASISELMMTWMLVVGTLGELLEINAYDQPGVESGKRLAREFLSSSR